MILKTDKKSVAIIKLQLLALAMLAITFLGVIVPISTIAVVELFLAAVYLLVLVFEAKKLFGKNFKAIAVFFVFLLAVILASFAVQLMPLHAISLRFQLLMAISIVVLVFFLAYRLFVSRNFSHGTVVSSDKHSAVVETEFDFLAGINAGKHHIKTAKHYAAGHRVKLKIGHGFFGRKPVEIME